MHARAAMDEFTYRSAMPVGAADLYDWHARPGALERLTPPWDPVRVVERTGGLEAGARVVLDVPIGAGPLAVHLRWVARQGEIVPGVRFTDEQIEGPFAHWVHTHLMEPDGPTRSFLDDRIVYAPPLGAGGRLLAARLVPARLARMFRFRHDTLRGDLLQQTRYAGRPPLRIAMTGADGLIGRTLAPFLTTAGHTIVPLVRRAPRAGSAEVQWSIERGLHDPAALGRVDAVIHLAGASIAGRWTAVRKAAIRTSRVDGTRRLAESLAQLPEPPRALLAASAIGYYGARDGDVYEEDGPGSDFLSEVGQAWEAAADPAVRAGIRVIQMRTGVVLTPAAGGALREMLRPFLIGAGGPMGDGQQPVSWIAMDDVVGGYHHALMTETLWGPVNLTAPEPVSNNEFAATLGRVLNRPAALRAPAFALRALLGEMAEPLLLTGSRVLPERLVASSYAFRFTRLEPALRHVLGRHISERDPQA